jgi:hypothetical protein
LPRSLHAAASAPNYGVKERAGRSGRDDGPGLFVQMGEKMFVIGLIV